MLVEIVMLISSNLDLSRLLQVLVNFYEGGQDMHMHGHGAWPQFLEDPQGI